MSTSTVDLGHKVVSRKEWLDARMAHLAKEKEFTRQRDQLLRARRELPWTKLEKGYVFEGPEGKTALADLFDGKSQLIVYHFMFGPDWEQGCPSCSMVADTVDATIVHVTQRDAAFAAVSRAPMEKIKAFKERMGWSFPWVSSFSSDFNQDFAVSFTAEQIAKGKPYNFGTSGFPSEEAPGVSVFYKNEAGEVFHTYSSYGRGLEGLLGVYALLDMAPKGRDEDALPYPMAWVRHHDRYEPVAAKRVGA
ncbi:DUF899 domain-containing protein [Edaphobacter bradus]|uniref:DUF899 domain-containing protein n=1 Tax=Edaphobacter bradus TaxID=2259016 RepID=UPI0021E021FC|nr:thioredoxin family protein [Edaphobacter bradus]